MKISKTRLKKLMANHSQKEIANIYGCSDSYISQQIKIFGLKENNTTKHIGKKYGQITILKYLGKDKHSHSIYNCVCNCGTNFNVLLNSIKSVNTKTCGCQSRKRGKDHALYAGYEEIRAEYWSRVLRGAKNRKIPLDITIEQAWQVFLQQDRKCALTGLPIHFPMTRKTSKYSTASLDRIDSSQGYTQDNIQWIHKKLQPMKMNMSQIEFLDWCEKIYKYNKTRSNQ
jgi:hypothetical protein